MRAWQQSPQIWTSTRGSFKSSIFSDSRRQKIWSTYPRQNCSGYHCLAESFGEGYARPPGGSCMTHDRALPTPLWRRTELDASDSTDISTGSASTRPTYLGGLLRLRRGLKTAQRWWSMRLHGRKAIAQTAMPISQWPRHSRRGHRVRYAQGLQNGGRYGARRQATGDVVVGIAETSKMPDGSPK